MSLDRSLKSANSLIRHRNVLTRDERLAKLKEEEKWTDGKSVFGLPKVAHRKQAVGGKVARKRRPKGTAAGCRPPRPRRPGQGRRGPAKGAAPAKGKADAKPAAAAPAKGKK